MFDVGFSELVVIGLVALIVIGPERLPRVARTAGLLLGRLQRYVNDVKSDINRQMQLDELKKLQEDMAAQVHGLESSVNESIRVAEDNLREVTATVTDAVSAAPSDALAASLDNPVQEPPAVAMTAGEPGSETASDVAQPATNAEALALDDPSAMQLELGLEPQATPVPQAVVSQSADNSKS